MTTRNLRKAPLKLVELEERVQTLEFDQELRDERAADARFLYWLGFGCLFFAALCYRLGFHGALEWTDGGGGT